MPIHLVDYHIKGSMVRTHKRTSDANADFKRVRRKVGRKAPTPANATETNFKSRTLHLREQSVVAEKEQLVLSSRNLSIAELIAKLSHHNQQVRQEAVEGLLEIINRVGTSSTELKSKLPDIVGAVLVCIADSEKHVRTATFQLFQALFKLKFNSMMHWFTPFFKLFMFHVVAGLSHLKLGIRLDAMLLVQIAQDYFPEDIKRMDIDILHMFTDVLSSSLERVGSRCLAASSTSTTSAQVSASAFSGGGILRSFKNQSSSQKKQHTSSSSSSTGDSHESWFRVVEIYSKFVEKLLSINQSVPHGDVNIDTSSKALQNRVLVSSSRNKGILYTQQDVSSDSVNYQKWFANLNVIINMWSQSFVLLQESCGSLQRGRVDRKRATSTLLLLKHSTVLVFYMLQYVMVSGQESLMQSCLKALSDTIGRMFPVDFDVDLPQKADLLFEINSKCVECILWRWEHSTDIDSELETKIVQFISSLDSEDLSPIKQSTLVKLALTYCKLEKCNETESMLATLGRYTSAMVEDGEVEEPDELLPFLETLCIFIEDHPTSLNIDWLLSLPRFAWQISEHVNGQDIIQRILDCLIRSRLHASGDMEYCHEIVKCLSTLFGTKSKTTSEYRPGPFLTHFSLKLRLQLLDTIRQFAVSRCPVNLLRGMANAIRSLTFSSSGQIELLASRMISIAFAPIDQAGNADAISDAISFTVSCLWTDEIAKRNDIVSCMIASSICNAQLRTQIPVITVLLGAIDNILVQKIEMPKMHLVERLLTCDEVSRASISTLLSCFMEISRRVPSKHVIEHKLLLFCVILTDDNNDVWMASATQQFAKINCFVTQSYVLKNLMEYCSQAEASQRDLVISRWTNALHIQNLYSDCVTHSDELEHFVQYLSGLDTKISRAAILEIQNQSQI